MRSQDQGSQRVASCSSVSLLTAALPRIRRVSTPSVKLCLSSLPARRQQKDPKGCSADGDHVYLFRFTKVLCTARGEILRISPLDRGCVRSRNDVKPSANMVQTTFGRISGRPSHEWRICSVLGTWCLLSELHAGFGPE